MNTKETILSKVDDFIIGADESDLERLDSALHENFMNVQNGFNGRKGEYSINKEEYVSLIAEKIWGGTPRKKEVVSVDIIGTIAMVKIITESSELRFSSYISLIFCETEEWKVIGHLPYVEMKS